MPSNEEIKQFGQVILRELEHIGGSTAPVACVQVAPTNTNEGLEYIFVTRGVFNHEMPSSKKSVIYVRSRLPLGRLAEADPGKLAAVSVLGSINRNTLTGQVFVSEYFIRCKNSFRVSNDAAQIDAIQNVISFPNNTDVTLTATPANNWSLLSPVTLPSGRYYYADTASSNQPVRFYRAVPQ